VLEAPVYGCGKQQIHGLQESHFLRGSIYVDAELNPISRIWKELCLVHELPMPSKPTVGRCAKNACIRVDQVRFWMDQSDDARDVSATPGVRHEVQVEVGLDTSESRLECSRCEQSIDSFTF
jgi:hypothetical protein